MLFGFPTPYPDELFYSVVARYQERIPNPSLSHLFQTLFRRSGMRLALPSNLFRFVQQLPPGFPLTTDALIDQHTLFPFFGTFLGRVRREALRSKMLTSSRVLQFPGVNHTPNEETRLLLCPTCRSEDLKSFGEAYWHRPHQLPGVFVCWRHNEPLLGIQQDIADQPQQGNLQQLFTPHSASRSLHTLSPSIEHQQLFEHAIICAEYLHKGHKLEASSVAIKYRKILKAHGGKNIFGDIEPPELNEVWDRIINQFGTRMKTFYWVDHKKAVGKAVLSDLLRGHEAATTKHLMLSTFLGVTPKSFIKHLRTLAPAPSPCRHPFAPCGGQLTIEKPKAFYNKLLFACPLCHYSYTIRPGDRFRNTSAQKIPYRVHDGGPSWKRKLQELWNQTAIPIDEIAATLGVDSFQVRLAASELGLPEAISTTNDRTYKVARALTTRRSNWREEDRHVATLIYDAGTKFDMAQTPPKRRTAAALFRCVPAEHVSRVKAHRRSPLTAAALKRAVECLDAYAERKLQWVVSECQRLSLIPCYSEFLRMSGFAACVARGSLSSETVLSAYANLRTIAEKP